MTAATDMYTLKKYVAQDKAIASKLGSHRLCVRCKSETLSSHDWTSIWLFPAGFALLIFFCFGLAFKGREAKVVQSVV